VERLIARERGRSRPGGRGGILFRFLVLLAAAWLGMLAAPATGRAAPLTVAAYYYPWYGPGSPQWSRGDLRDALAPPQQPLLGRYDSRDPAVIAQHYAWAHEYGIGVFLASWAGPGSYGDATIRDDLLPSPARGPTQVALLYESLQRLGLDPDARIYLTPERIAQLVSDFDYIARTYFSAPGYYRIAGRPVVELYASRIFRGPVAEAIAAIRSHLIATYGVNPYLIGDEVDWDSAPDRSRIRLYDAITGYTLYSRTQASGWPQRTRFLAAVEQHTREFRAAARAVGVDFVPDALPGFNDRAFRPEDGDHVLPRQVSAAAPDGSLFAGTLALAGRLVDPGLDLLAVTSFNEWQEDTQIEPTAPALPTADPFAATQGYAYGSYGTALLAQLAAFEQEWDAAARFRRLGGPIP
jgi:hypothetical protein